LKFPYRLNLPSKFIVRWYRASKNGKGEAAVLCFREEKEKSMVCLFLLIEGSEKEKEEQIPF
jgi:hypothetical protein